MELFWSRLTAPSGLRRLQSLLIVSIVISPFFLMPVLLHDGWPYNHDGQRPIARMAIIAEHWRLGQPIPIWASNPVMGHGSPSPILYHKAFTTVSALYFILTERVKASLCLALLTFMVAGFIGAALATREMLGKKHPVLETYSGIMMLSCNYAATEIWVRGAFAEFAAYCVIPFLFWWCFALLRRGTWNLGIGFILGILVLCHSAIALFSLLPLVMALLIASVRHKRLVFTWIGPALSTVAISALLFLPFAVPMAAFSGYGRVKDFVQAGYTPRTSHLPFARLLWDRDWLWDGDNWTRFSPQLDTGLLLAFVAFGCLTATRYGRRLPFELVLFLILSTALMLFLQTPAAFEFFDLFPGGVYLQFSWRLLVFLSPCLIFLSACLLDMSANPRLQAAIALLIILSTFQNKEWWLHPKRPWFSGADLVSAIHLTHDSDPIEYFPRSPAVGWEATLQATRELDRFDVRSCTVLSGQRVNTEQSKIIFKIDCARPVVVPLNPFWAPGIRVSLNGRLIESWRTRDDPRVHVLAPAGACLVTVRFPVWTTTIADFLHARLR